MFDLSAGVLIGRTLTAIDVRLNATHGIRVESKPAQIMPRGCIPIAEQVLRHGRRPNQVRSKSLQNFCEPSFRLTK